MKTIHTYKTYDGNDCTSAGDRLELRTDGSIKITSRSCWQGSRSGRVILTAPGTIALPLPSEEEDPDMDAVLAAWAEAQWGAEPEGRLLRTGYIVG